MPAGVGGHFVVGDAAANRAAVSFRQRQLQTRVL
jgi:hypothetical protein